MNLPVKYRPKTFDELVGQVHVTRTLQNALKRNQVGHAYLFAGPRGVGKTTAARILAKGLNCEKGVTPEPCNACVACREINEGKSLDVVEIDGASNRGIDEIRELKERIAFAPVRGRRRVYIIDEVHMLTREAFNALLKTLEEPPYHVVFVLATTDPEKVPPTILSRTQRFDFRPLPEFLIQERLAAVARQEGIKVEEGALALIARQAEGSLRDALALLEQMVSFAASPEEGIMAEDVERFLGLIRDEFYRKLFAALVRRDAPQALRLLDEVLLKGHTLRDFVTGFYDAALRLLRVILDLEENGYREVARELSQEDALLFLRAGAEMEEALRLSARPRARIEYILARLALGPRTAEVRRLLRATGVTALSGPSPEEPQARPAPQTLEEVLAGRFPLHASLLGASATVREQGDRVTVVVRDAFTYDLLRRDLDALNAYLKETNGGKQITEVVLEKAADPLRGDPVMGKFMERFDLEVMDDAESAGSP